MNNLFSVLKHGCVYHPIVLKQLEKLDLILNSSKMLRHIYSSGSEMHTYFKFFQVI